MGERPAALGRCLAPEPLKRVAMPAGAAALERPRDPPHGLAQVITTIVAGWPGVTHCAVRGGVISGACWIGTFGFMQ